MIAAIHGKDVPEARHHEDLLTSDVFGHLRYLPPGVFWRELFEKAIDANDHGTLSDRMFKDKNAFTTLEVEFWPHPEDGIGEPDMMLTFGNRDKKFTIVVEVKLYAEQSGDQLARYMKLVTDNKADCLLYLTPRESLREIEDAIESNPGLEKYRNVMFRLQWQDVLEVAENVKDDWREARENSCCTLILTDVAELLRKRGLERFSGMKECNELEYFESKPAPWAGAGNDLHFVGMTTCSLELFTIEKGRWNHD